MAAPGSSGVVSMPAIVAPGPSSGPAPDASKESKWIMTREQMQNSPSRRDGISPDQELNLRQKAAYLIQDMGQRLRVSQLCINTAIVYMHRFYMFHSFQLFHRTGIAAACLFLGAKVEEQPRKVESIIQMLFASQNLKFPEVGSTTYQEQSQDLVFNENVLLQTLGFDVAVDHPHTHVVKTCHLVKACKDLSQTSYFLASNSLHLTTMCVQYRPTVVACFCIYLACKWSRWEIPQSTEGKYWFHYVDRTVTMEILEQLTNEFLFIYDNSPSRLKKQLNNCKGLGLNSKSPVQPGSSSQMPRPHHSQLSAQPQTSASSSSHQRSTVHHHAGKLPHPMATDHQKLPGQSSSGQMLAKPTQPTPNMSAASSVPTSRHPQQPHFSAPHRTSSGINNGMPPMPSSHQLQAYGMASGGSSSASNKSRHPQQPPQQQQQPPYSQHLNANPQMLPGGSSGSDARHLSHQQQQLHMHQHQQKHRSSKDAPPPKYMDPKMPAPQSTGVLPPGSSTSMATTGTAASKKIPYPQQQQPSHPNASGQGQAAAGLNHKYDMSKQPVTSQPHLANKPSNYPTQPPNYNQSIAGRSDGSGHQHHGGSHLHQQTTSVHPQHHQLAQKASSHPQPQHHQHHNHTQSNPFGMSDPNTGAYNRLSSAAGGGTAPPSTSGDDLMAMMMMDTLDSGKSKVSSMFNTDYSNMTSQKPKRDPATLSSSTSMDMNAGYKNHTFGAANRNAAPTSATSSKHRGDEFSAGQLLSAPPSGVYGLPKPQSQPQQRTDDSQSDFSKMSKRSHGDDYGTHDPIAGNDYQRDLKFRKVEPVVNAPESSNHSYGIAGGGHHNMYGAPMAGTSTPAGGISSLLKSGTSFNGIETNPDLVSSLLKESLCGTDTSKYSNNLLTGGSSSIGGPSAVDFDTSMLSLDSILDSKPPLNLLATDTMPAAATIQFMDHSTASVAAAAAAASVSAAAASGSANDSSDHEHRHKSEKKKKKEKSKHKDKSKDRDERKKHKKDKERNRERSEGDPHYRPTNGDPAADTGLHNPIKLKIPIPKDHRLSAGGETQAAPLKIKISKPAHTYS